MFLRDKQEPYIQHQAPRKRARLTEYYAWRIYAVLGKAFHICFKLCNLLGCQFGATVKSFVLAFYLKCTFVYGVIHKLGGRVEICLILFSIFFDSFCIHFTYCIKTILQFYTVCPYKMYVQTKMGNEANMTTLPIRKPLFTLTNTHTYLTTHSLKKIKVCVEQANTHSSSEFHW